MASPTLVAHRAAVAKDFCQMVKQGFVDQPSKSFAAFEYGGVLVLAVATPTAYASEVRAGLQCQGGVVEVVP